MNIRAEAIISALWIILPELFNCYRGVFIRIYFTNKQIHLLKGIGKTIIQSPSGVDQYYTPSTPDVTGDTTKVF